MDLRAKIQQRQQEVVQSQTEVLTTEAHLEDLRKQHHMNVGALRTLQQLAAEAEAEEAEAEKKKQADGEQKQRQSKKKGAGDAK